MNKVTFSKAKDEEGFKQLTVQMHKEKDEIRKGISKVKLTKEQFNDEIDDLLAYLTHAGLCIVSENNNIFIENLDWSAEVLFADNMESCMQFPESEEMDYIIKQL